MHLSINPGLMDKVARKLDCFGGVSQSQKIGNKTQLKQTEFTVKIVTD